MASFSDFAQRIKSRQPSAVAQMISSIESGVEGAGEQVARLYALGGHARVIGITGPAGSGKSTLVAALAREFRARNRTVGVIAVDPSSAFSGGSILGDRIRMKELLSDPGIFFRSMATRGALGGLSRATADAVTVLDAAGNDFIVVETVGAGQVEVDIMQIAHSILVVSVPGLGDDIQLMKAGLLEIADIHVVNKADRPEANNAMTEFKRAFLVANEDRDDDWRVPVVATIATSGEGIGELLTWLDRHEQWLRGSGKLERREREIAAARIQAIAQTIVLKQLHAASGGVHFEAVVDDVRSRKVDPLAAAQHLIKQSFS